MYHIWHNYLILTFFVYLLCLSFYPSQSIDSAGRLIDTSGWIIDYTDALIISTLDEGKKNKQQKSFFRSKLFKKQSSSQRSNSSQRSEASPTCWQTAKLKLQSLTSSLPSGHERLSDSTELANMQGSYTPPNQPDTVAVVDKGDKPSSTSSVQSAPVKSKYPASANKAKSDLYVQLL